MRLVLAAVVSLWSTWVMADPDGWQVNLSGRYGMQWQQEPEDTPRTNATSEFISPVSSLILTTMQNQVAGLWRFNFAKADDPLTWAEIGLHTKRLRVAFGKIPLPLGGLAAERIGAKDWWRPRYLSLTPVPYFSPGAYFHLDFNGLAFKLVAFNDVVSGVEERWNRNPHPTVGGEMRWSYRGVTLLLQGAGYDNNKSHWVDAAAGWSGAVGRLELSYRYQNDSYRVETADLVRDIGKVTSAFTLRTGVDFGSHGAFWEWSEFEVTQANEPGISRDRTENGYARDDAGSRGDRVWDDHGTMTLLGYEYDRRGPFSWFAWFGSEQGRWPRADRVDVFRTLRGEAGVRLATAAMGRKGKR